MADETPDESSSGADARKRKPPPPRVRIRTSDAGAKVVDELEPPVRRAPPEPIPEPTPPPARKVAPPLAGGAVALEREAPPAREREAEAPAAAPKKPPPPHITGGRRASPPPVQEERPAPRPEARPAPEEAPAPATVRISARPAAQKAAPPAGGAPAASAAKDDDHDHAFEEPDQPATERPHIGTDAGRLSALTTAMWMLLFVVAIEVYAGFAANSLALFSDASHSFTDFFAFGIAAAAVMVSQRKSTARETYGWHRAEVLAAFVSGIILILVVVRIYTEAASRLTSSAPVDLTYMLTVPWLPVFVNLYLARRMSGAHDVNMEGARLHAISDLLSSLGVIGAGVLIAVTGNVIFDPLVSFFIGLLILSSALRLLRESADILLEKSPAKIDVHHVVDRMKEVEGVTDVHSVHVWSLCSTVHALSAHVVAGPTRDGQRVLEATRAALQKHFSVAYTTLQIENEPCGAERHPTAIHTGAEPAHGHA